MSFLRFWLAACLLSGHVTPSRDVVQDDIGHLHHQSRYYDVGNGDPEYIPAF